MRLKEEKIKETPAFYRKEVWKLVNPLKHHQNNNEKIHKITNSHLFYCLYVGLHVPQAL